MSRVEIYRETRRQSGVGIWEESLPVKWRWRFISNGHTMADSGQGYSRRIDCLNGCATVLGGRIYSDEPGLDIEIIARRMMDGKGAYIPVVDLTKTAK